MIKLFINSIFKSIRPIYQPLWDFIEEEERKEAAKKREDEMIDIIMPLLGNDKEMFKTLLSQFKEEGHSDKGYYDSILQILKKHSIVIIIYPGGGVKKDCEIWHTPTWLIQHEGREVGRWESSSLKPQEDQA